MPNWRTKKEVKVKLTAKQELFAREVAKGTNQYQSFCIAYPLQARNSKRESLDINASKLAKNAKVVLRIEALQKDALNNVKYDIEAHFNELDMLKDLSLTPRGKDGNIDVSTATRNVELKGKLKGLYIERKQVEQVNTDLEFREDE